MPGYEYKTDDGDVVIEFMSVAEKAEREDADGRITLTDGRTGKRWFSSSVGVPSTKWGYWSNGLGTNPQDAPRLRQELCDAGISARVNDRGQVWVDGRGLRRRILRARNMRDNDAGYSD